MNERDAARLTVDQASQVVADVRARWVAAFHTADWPAMQSLYTSDAQLFGGKQSLYLGHAGVLRYFSSIPLTAQLSAAFDLPHIIAPTADTLVAAGFVQFGRDDGTPVRTYRMTQMLVRRAGQWLICSHHASPKDAMTPDS